MRLSRNAAAPTGRHVLPYPAPLPITAPRPRGRQIEPFSAPIVTDPGVWPGTTSTAYYPDLLQPVSFEQLPQPVRGMMTHAVYITPPQDRIFNLAGPSKGREGVRLATTVQGDQQWPYKQVLVNSPYMFGASIERQNIPERIFDLGIIIGSQAPPMTEYQYRLAEDQWWQGQDEANDGWFGVYTRYSGWRWIPVRPNETVKSPQKIDPTAFGNNASQWDITWVAARPYFTKTALFRLFDAAAGTPAPYAPPQGGGILSGLLSPLVTLIDEVSGLPMYYWGTLPIANRGDLPSYATFYVTSPGQAVVQDNESSRLVALPFTQPSVGTYMCDTEPGHRTLTAANDPTDNLIFDIIRQSMILDFFLSGIANEGLPLQLTWNGKFMFAIPPQTVVNLTVGHSDPNGQILAVVPQRFKRSR
jgi:hypothetical protein